MIIAKSQWVLFLFGMIILTACSKMTKEEAALRYHEDKRHFHELLRLILDHPKIRYANPAFDPEDGETSDIESWIFSELSLEDRQVYSRLLRRMAELKIGLISSGAGEGRWPLSVDFQVASYGILDDAEGYYIVYMPDGNPADHRYESPSSCIPAGDPHWFVCHSKYQSI